MSVSPADQPTPAPTRWRTARRREVMLFLLLAVVIWPFIAVGVVAGWGFAVWIYQMIAGPPGPV
jgi:nitrate reductase NapE